MVPTVVSQLLLDLVAWLVSAIIDTFPPLPFEFNWAVEQLASSAASIAPSIAALGPVVPFAQINVVLGLFSVAVTFWLTLLVVRAVLWAVNR